MGVDKRRIDTPLEVLGDLVFSGQAKGGGVVRTGAHLHLSGQMSGELVIEHGASVHLSGQLKGVGKVLGTLDVTGQLNGALQLSEAGRVTFATGSSMVRAGQTFVVSDSGNFRPAVPMEFHAITESTPRWVYQHDGSLIADESERPSSASQ